MRKIVMLAALCGFAVVVPAQADRPGKPQKPDTPNPNKCVAHSVGYNAKGTFVSASLTKGTDGRYTGTIVVNVTRANHHGATGSQSFPLTDARVKFHHGVDTTAPAVGSRVGLHGKITQLPHSCSTDGFTPVVTVKKVDIRTPKP